MGGLTGETPADTIKRSLSSIPIEFEPPIGTMGKPLIIEFACPGGMQSKFWGPKELYTDLPPGYKEGGVRFPAIPCSIEDQVSALVAGVKAGAAAVHIHPRDPADCRRSSDPVLLANIYDKVLDQVDAVALNHVVRKEPVWPELPDYIAGLSELFELGKGNKYCQGACMLWPPSDAYCADYVPLVQDAVRFMEAHDVKPIHNIRGPYHLRKMKRALLDTNILTKKPFIMNHDMGHPRGWPLDIDPWWPYEMITGIMSTKTQIPDSVIGVSPGGRNWLPITTLAILIGADLVRTGIEDAYWMYPHKDEIIADGVDTVRKVVAIAKELGRPIATPEQARKILGLKVTYPSKWTKS